MSRDRPDWREERLEALFGLPEDATEEEGSDD